MRAWDSDRGAGHLRRVVLKEKDKPGAANIGLIELVTRYALDTVTTPCWKGSFYRALRPDV